MLDTEGQWSEALASNNVRAIIRWLRTLEGEVDMEEILPTFSCWVQRTSEFTKKELLTLCFSRCQSLWMFLDRSSFTRVHMLLQRLRNLLTLAEWARRQLTSAHLWHGVGVPCVVCRDTLSSSDVRRGCWGREHRALKQHIWLGRLVQWFGIMGLLPKLPEAHEVKRISQMWKEMEHSHQKSYLETLGWEEEDGGRGSSFIRGLVTELSKKHGCIWASEDCRDQRYPPPDLQALLKLVLVPRIDNMSVQAILMYFILDMTSFLQCRDDLLRSFCLAFTIPAGFSQQIRALWLLDHGHVKASMELLLSPRAAVPWLPWQHRCIIHCLLTRKQPSLALRYLHWARPAIESTEDAKLFADVLLQNSCVSAAWALLRRGHTESDDAVMYFLQACNRFGLCTEALKYIPAGCNDEGDNGIKTTGMKEAGRPPCPLSAKLYQAQNTVSPGELVQLVRFAAMEVRNPCPKISEVVWPEHAERKSNSREMFLSTQDLSHLTPGSPPMDLTEEQTAHTEEPGEELIHNQHETHKHTSSCENLTSESVSSFTAASSLPLLRRGRPHVYESTLTLQRISSLLTDSENQSVGDDEEESRPPSSVDVLPDCPELLLTPDGATDLLSHSNWKRGVSAERVLSAEEGEHVETGVFASEDSPGGDTVSGLTMDETLPPDKSFRMDVSPQPCSNGISQSHPSLCEAQLESHSFLSPDFGVTDLWSTVMPQDDQSDCIASQIFSLCEAALSDCFVEEDFHQKACEHHQQEEALGCFTQDPSCSLLTDLHHSPLLEEPTATGASGDLVKMGVQDSPLLSPVFSLISTSSAPSETSDESPHTARLKTDDPCVQSTSAGPDHCKVGSWWRQDTETHGASSGLVFAAEPGAAFASDNSRALNQPYSYSLLTFMDFTANLQGDKRGGKQADKEEPAGWSSGKASQGAMRSGRTRSRKGKRVKRA
ncbi:uncharacterized protein LOC118116278 isoform X3 [Hippoglossus stenolepis]|uniref:uncharacterized protein LOC118116278 isoform X3 n=1 Tax=Hippoglossus stenolepis TaxID=195615 RepID=UPI00159C8BC2|nr:uncharacterized protein LOC118116278 isoform X3 [Hippoglossus stenolepis]